ncbi:hypothetical protein SDC9_93630 [bioreactor metagenome]|uniref:Uncharacterized protein n=1 Tax=bioreactor metagenome TaxID=1076179 RepID=A0A645A7S3_9ZZZZ
MRADNGQLCSNDPDVSNKRIDSRDEERSVQSAAGLLCSYAVGLFHLHLPVVIAFIETFF